MDQFPHDDDCDDRTEEEKFQAWADNEIRRLKELLAAEKAERIVAELQAERAERAYEQLKREIGKALAA